MLRAKFRVRRFSLLVRKMLAEFHPNLAAFPLEHGYPAAPVTWTNFYRFWPVVGYYKSRILAKGARLIFSNSRFLTADPMGVEGNGTSRLKRPDEELRDLLCLRATDLQAVIEPSILRGRLAREGNSLNLSKEEKRLVTLEYTLRTLKVCQTPECIKVG